jgi:hypothetical protein
MKDWFSAGVHISGSGSGIGIFGRCVGRFGMGRLRFVDLTGERSLPLRSTTRFSFFCGSGGSGGSLLSIVKEAVDDIG